MRTVHDIMSPIVCSIDRDTLVAEVEGIFVSNEIGGAPLVDEYDKVTGFISKSDITHFDFTGGDPNEAKAWEIANPNIITIDESASVQDAARLMTVEHVHHLIVTDGHNMVGMLSAFDIVKLVADGEI